MSTTAQTTATTRVPMDSTRKTALVAGIFYLITFVSIPTLVPPLALYSSVNGHGLHHQLRRRHRRALGRLPRGHRRPRRHRHRRHAVPGGQAAERRHGARLRRLPHP